MRVLHAITMAMMRKTVSELIVLCALCMCRFPGMAMAAENYGNELSSPPPSSSLEKPVKANPMSPRQREEQLKQILEDAGYRSLSKLVGELLTQGIIVDRSSPLTLFAPSDEAFKKYMFQSMDPRRILGYHTVKGLFSSPDLARLPVGTKLHTILPGHFLALTAAPGTREYSTTLGIRVEGVEISHPDMFSDGQFLTIHGIDTFFKAEEEEGSASVKPRWQQGRRRTTYLLEEATVELRDRGYSALAIALRLAPSILGLDNFTVFAPDDDSVFLQAGEDYFNHLGYHLLPNQRLLYADLARLPAGTTLQTIMSEDPSSSLLVTTNSSSSSSSSPRREDDAQVSINYVCIRNPNVFSNAFIAVHGIPHPFPQLYAAANSTPIPQL